MNNLHPIASKFSFEIRISVLWILNEQLSKKLQTRNGSGLFVRFSILRVAYNYKFTSEPVMESSISRCSNRAPVPFRHLTNILLVANNISSLR
jgi:hypothetical protein